MRFGAHEVWEDVMDESLDAQVAPELGDVASGSAPEIYRDPREFFRRTYFTESMLEIIGKLLETLEGRGRHNIFLVYSLFGGGKTHTLLTIYHAFMDPDAMLDSEVLGGHDPEKRERIRNLAERVKSLGDVEIVPVYGKGRLGQPSKPLEDGPYRIKTLWGYIARALERYDEVKGDDENGTVPDIDTLRGLFRGKRVVLLIDEIANYVDNLYNSGREEDRRYAKNAYKFFDHLATALLGSRSVMLMTLPMEKREGVFHVEKEYSKEVVLALREAVSRVGGSELYSPLRTSGSSNELVEVLKKRIFKEIDEEKRVETLKRVHSELINDEIFGPSPGFEDDLRRSFPFHPEYIEVLRAIIRRTGLQRTRDMLRITRITVRGLVNEYAESGFAPALIMPHHVDLRNEKVRGMLFGKSEIFNDYAAIVDTDLSEDKFRDFRHPELAEIILKYVFLKTYPFDSPVELPGFPTLKSIARGVYEPNLFAERGWLPADIRDALDEVTTAVRFIYLNKKEGVLWFWRVANVAQMVDNKTRELKDLRAGEVWNNLANYVNRMIREKKSIHRKGVRIEDHVTFFRRENVVVSREPEDLRDDPEYKLQVLVRDDVDERELRKLIYKSGTGTRTYRNTVIVCYPVRGSFDHLLETTARIMACDEVAKNIKVKFGKYGEDVVKIQMNMVRDIKSKSLEELETQIVSSFRMVAYPDGDDVKTITAQASSKSVVENVYSSLVSKGKIADEFEFEFEWLVNTLKEAGVDILRPEGYRVSELIRLIRSNTRLHMIEDERIFEAIRSAVRNLDIGLERGGRIFFKKVHSEVPSAEEEGDPPEKVMREDVILPRGEALNRQVCSLLEGEKDLTLQRGGKSYRVRTWYEVYSQASGVWIPLKSLVERDGGCRIREDYVDTVLWGYIVKREEETPVTEGEFDIEIDKPVVEGRPGTPAEVKATVKPLGGGTFTVELSASRGELDLYEVKLEGGQPVDVTWTMAIPETETVAKIEGRSPVATHGREVRLIPKLGAHVVETRSLTEEHRGTTLTAILGIEDLETLGMIPESLKGTISGSLLIDPFWEGRFEGLDRGVLAYLVREMEEILEGRASLEANLSLSEEVRIDDLLFEKLRPLSGKVTFRLRREEGNGGKR